MSGRTDIYVSAVSESKDRSSWGIILTSEFVGFKKLFTKVTKVTKAETELLAVIKALEIAKENEGEVVISTNARRVVDGIKRANNWAKNGWVGMDGSKLRNSFLWKPIHKMISSGDLSRVSFKLNLTDANINMAKNAAKEALSKEFSAGYTEYQPFETDSVKSLNAIKEKRQQEINSFNEEDSW